MDCCEINACERQIQLCSVVELGWEMSLTQWAHTVVTKDTHARQVQLRTGVGRSVRWRKGGPAGVRKVMGQLRVLARVGRAFPFPFSVCFFLISFVFFQIKSKSVLVLKPKFKCKIQRTSMKCNKILYE
jgi:hypothetical protein